ncbi:SDR family NAD(P)-dependent oxidoreductase [Vibrio sp. MEBiC08052]|uniref:SDR family NAD(P)-dependent oxidoreductase n=1 Tax=Vibrio sp. MEBiC08052 TaxID=1761910 RepID=UPI000740687F|nr:SDR family oxidoreductase [Vibrio sp. MEBiC08052]KUI99536.1 oxidoreductase [Vibrio sp. MEBiC08052]
MNKVAFITGGSRGIGREAALKLAEQHVDIIFTYHRNEKAALDVVEKIQQKGQKAFSIQCDIRDGSLFDDLAETVSAILNAQLGRETLDYLLNNAGTGVNANIEQTGIHELDDMLNIHVKGPFFLTQKLLPLIEQGGHIVNISSGLTRFSFPGSAAYAMAKGAVEVMTRYMAKEFAAKGIRVNTLAPGAIMTDFKDGAIRHSEQAQAMIASVTALGRVGEADDIGKIIAAMFSDGFGWVTGQRIEASGGMML